MPSWLPKPDAKNYLKYLEGNLKQIQNLASRFSFTGKLARHSIRSEGKLSYQQPDKTQLEIAPTDKTIAVRVLVGGTVRKVEPNVKSPAGQLAFDGLPGRFGIFLRAFDR